MRSHRLRVFSIYQKPLMLSHYHGTSNENRGIRRRLSRRYVSDLARQSCWYHHVRTMFSIELLRSEDCFLTGTLRFQYTGVDDTTIKQCSISKNKALFFFL